MVDPGNTIFMLQDKFLVDHPVMRRTQATEHNMLF